ncbi:unnamed protein product [Rhizoctonia solani]|uniref:BTB domain-containing protein n=1 Tax=Rhizoctonia solani TaxID=456999 RepID=A0A8H3DEW5_9AGAM|nr:unnamed protein product [Rhizoctonia solani]
MAKKNAAKLKSRAGRWVFTDSVDTESDDNSSETPGGQSSGAVERHSEFFFDNTLVAIQIEKTLFNVHKYQLAKSEVFSDMFKIPKPAGDEPEEGSSPEHPIRLEGVSASDFAALLKVLYASQFSSHQLAPEAPLVIPAFRLANMFNFSDLRAFLLPLAEKNLDEVDKIVFAREFDIEEWLVPAHVRLCQREKPLSVNEAKKLGVESVLILWRLREQYRTRPASSMNASRYYCSSCSGINYNDYDSDGDCDACGGESRVCRYEGPGRTAQDVTTTIDDEAIETELKKWVEEGYNPAEIPSTKPSEPIIRHSEFFFDNTLIAIQIENTLFNVHKYQLVKSEVFSDMFKLPKSESGEPEEGSSPEHPIVIHGAAASDFAALLKVLYASHFSSHQPAPQAALIIPAFRLANLLGFADLRTYLLPLAEQNLDDVDKIVFAREFDIKEWLVPAFVRLCKREEHLSMEEAMKLEVVSVLMISSMREKYRGLGITATVGNGFIKNVATRFKYFLPPPHNMAKKKPATLTSRAGSMVYMGKASDTKPNNNPIEIAAEEPSPTIVEHSEFFFDNTLIAIQIGNTLFNVHKYQLAKSEVFSDMFKLPKPEGDEPQEGSSPKHPIVIEGVTASDFTALLRVLYASHFSSNPPAPEASLIIPAFRLANMFNFSDLRAFLLPLAEKNLGDVDKIVFAREFDIKEWLAPAFVSLCQREERLTIEEARKLEVDSVLMVSHMREQYLVRGSPSISGQYYCSNCVGMTYYGNGITCKHCNSYASGSSSLRCSGPGTMWKHNNTDSTSIEAEVKKWVDNSYATRR